jgi:hypothetical protein
MEIASHDTSDSYLAVTMENNTLRLKAEEVDSKFNSLVRQFQKKKLKPVSHKIFLRANKSYDKVQSHMQYDQIFEHQRIKKIQNSKEQEKLELKDCTFTPSINANSNDLIGSNYVPLSKRPLPRGPKSSKKEPCEESVDDLQVPQKKVTRLDGITEDISQERLDSMAHKQTNERTCLTENDWENRIKEVNLNDEEEKVETIEKVEVIEPQEPKVLRKIRKYNPHFYDEQYVWKTFIDQKRATEKLVQTRKEYETFNPMPTVNKEANELLVKTDKSFLERVQDDLDKSKKTMKTLEQKYYGFDFRPQINKSYATTRNIESEYKLDKESAKRRGPKATSADKMAKKSNPNDNENIAHDIMYQSELVIQKNPLANNATVSQVKEVLVVQSSAHLPLKSNASRSKKPEKKIDASERYIKAIPENKKAMITQTAPQGSLAQHFETEPAPSRPLGLAPKEMNSKEVVKLFYKKFK